MQVILEQVSYEIQLSGFERQLIAGVVLTGGGARMKNVKELSEFIVGIDTRLGMPDEHLDKEGSITFEDFSHPMYATGIGLVIYGILEHEQLEHVDEEAEAIPSSPEPEPVDEPVPDPIADAEQVVDKKKRKDGDGRNLGKVVGDFLSKIFTEEELGE